MAPFFARYISPLAFSFFFVAFSLGSMAQAQIACYQIWQLSEDGEPVDSELLPAPLDDELIVPSSEDSLLQNNLEDVHVLQLETFGNLLSQHDSSVESTLFNQSIQNRNWQIFQNLYGIEIARDIRGQWEFTFHTPRSVQKMAKQLQLSESRLEAIIQEMHFVRIRRLRVFPAYWEAYRQIVDRQLPFGKKLQDYIELLKQTESDPHLRSER